MKAHTTTNDGLMKEMPEMVLLVIAKLLSGFFPAFIFPRRAGIKTLKGGIVGAL